MHKSDNRVVVTCQQAPLVVELLFLPPGSVSQGADVFVYSCHLRICILQAASRRRQPARGSQLKGLLPTHQMYTSLYTPVSARQRTLMQW